MIFFNYFNYFIEKILLIKHTKEPPYYRLENKNLEGVYEDRIVKNTFSKIILKLLNAVKAG